MTQPGATCSNPLCGVIARYAADLHVLLTVDVCYDVETGMHCRVGMHLGTPECFFNFVMLCWVLGVQHFSLPVFWGPQCM